MKSIVLIRAINAMNLRTFDLNLLRVLDAMLGARNTTRVAETIGLTQPAVSAALRRLRAALGDPLFVRQGDALVPTPFAAALQQPVPDLLGELGAVLSGGGPTPDWIERQLMFAGGCAVVARRDHPRLKRLGLGWGAMLPLDAFCDVPQAIFSVDDAFVRPEDDALAALGCF